MAIWNQFVLTFILMGQKFKEQFLYNGGLSYGNILLSVV